MSDNPIFKIVEDVLGLKTPPSSFNDKLTRLDLLLNNGIQQGPRLPINSLLRRENNLFESFGSTRYSGQIQVQGLQEKLLKSGLLPEQSRMFFDTASREGGSFYYNEGKQALFYGTSKNLTALPLQLPSGHVSIGGRSRAASRLQIVDDSGPMSYAEAYYTNLSAGSGDISSRAGVHNAIVNARKSGIGSLGRVSSLLRSGTTVRGISTPMEAGWVNDFYALTAGPKSTHPLLDAWKDRNLAQMSFAVMVKTGGRVIPSELSTMTGSTDVGANFNAIRDFNTNYVEQLGSYLESNNLLQGVPYIKPEYLGNKRKLLMGGLGAVREYGSKFEEHSIKKGLYQLAKMRNKVSLRVGVVDFETEAHSRMLFQEGGSYITRSGAGKLIGNSSLPMGSVKLNGIDEAGIAAAEQLFGFNLGEGSNLLLNNNFSIDRQEIRNALSKMPLEDLTSKEAHLRTLFQSSGRYRGALREMLLGGGKLGKVQLTEAGLNLDFVTQSGFQPGAFEYIVGARRTTGVTASPIQQALSKEQLSNFDVFVSADEFKSMFGANVYLENFRAKASKYLSDQELRITSVTNHDEAFAAAQDIVSNWARTGNEQQKRLAEEIVHGTEVLSSSNLGLGIKGIRGFNILGGIRTDFMGDINLMKPLTYTASKMLILASGAKQLGYKSHEDHPIYRMLKGQSVPWKEGLIGVRSKSNQLFLSEDHIMRQYASSLLGQTKGINIRAEQLISIGSDGRFMRGGIALDRLPGEMSYFSHHNGGYPIDALKNTLLGIDEDLVYLDIGSPKTLNLLGLKKGGGREYSRIPIPLKYLRVNQGVRGNLTVGKSHPSYAMFKGLIELQRTGSIDRSEKLLAEGFFDINKALAGRKGLFNLHNTIRVPGGARARLIPGRTGYHNFANWTEESKLFDLVVNRQEFMSMLTRKSAMDPRYVKNVRQVLDRGDPLHIIMGADPMQRSGHLSAYRLVMSDRKVQGSKLGQLTVEAHPSALRAIERDTDRDVVSFLVSQGLDPSSGDEMEALIGKQTKQLAPFLWYDKYMSMKAVPESKLRLANMKFGNIKDHLSSIIGLPKSLGYTVTRASDTIMDNIIGYGVDGAKELGIISDDVSEGMIKSIIAPFEADPLKHSVSRNLLQNLFQGAVQKGSDKTSLTSLAENLVTTARKYRGENFNLENLVSDVSKEIKPFLLANKDRAFEAIDYFATQIPEVNESLSLIKHDLERGRNQVLDEVAEARLTKFRDILATAQADLIASRVGPGMMLSSSVKSSPRGVESIIQSLKKSLGTPETVYKNVLSPATGVFRADMSEGIGRTLEDDIVKAIEKSKTKGILSQISDFIKTDRGHLLAGIAIGAGAAGAIMGLSSGPQPPPMPRDIDSRQPTDMGPEIISKPPRIYGSNQVFGASKRRSPETFSSVGPYTMGVNSDPRITIRDKTAPMNPYLLEKHLKSVASSDYNYQ